MASGPKTVSFIVSPFHRAFPVKTGSPAILYAFVYSALSDDEAISLRLEMLGIGNEGAFDVWTLTQPRTYKKSIICMK